MNWPSANEFSYFCFPNKDVSVTKVRLAAEELYKFNTVAELFGSEFVKKILITADMDRSCDDPDSLRERMDEMGIKRLEMVHQRGEAALARALRGLCGV